MPAMSTGKLVVGVTGASGAIYAVRFLRAASAHFAEMYLIASDQALQVANHELGLSLSRDRFSVQAYLGCEAPGIRLLGEKDYFTPPASGSSQHDGMVIIPCSMGTIGRIANGVSNDLLTRSADVCLKERRKLVVVPREMPYNLIMLRNMTSLCEAGATILPASPAWYGGPKSMDELADTVVARVLQQFGVPHSLLRPWMDEE